MNLGITDKVALVSAASRGLGRAVALGLAGEGAQVALCARNPEDLDRTAREVTAAGSGQVLARPVDVTDPDAVADFVAEVSKELGPPALCLVNAGGPPAATFQELDLTAWQAAYRLTLQSAVQLCRQVLPGMMERGFGRIVQITSIAVRQPVDNLFLSNVLRPSVHALTRCLALEAASQGVTVNSVAPGYHLTSAVERLIQKKIEFEGCTRQDVLASWEREIPAGRLGDADELAALVLFLMSEKASYITGQCIVADGGWVRGTF